VPHWTYSDVEAVDDLYQGDIIARSEPLLDLFQRVHPHFCDEKYLGFLITTQTCDLVRRGSKACKTKHINLAAIRSLDDLVPDFFREICGTEFEGIYLEESKYEARQLLGRIINQNEQAHGIFYLHPDADAGIAVPAIALLRVSIALRSGEHYDLLCKERCGRISTEYRNKLGWLAGNLYSRIDTPDWSDHQGGAAQAEETISGFLGGIKLEKENVWVKANWIEEARKKKVDVGQLPRDRVFQTLMAFEPSPPLPTVIGRIRDLGTRALQQLRGDQIAEIVIGIGQSAGYRALVTERVFRAVFETITDGGRSAALLLPRLDDEAFSAEVPAAMNAAVARYQAHRGSKDLTTLLTFFAEADLFSAAAIERVALLIELPEGADSVGITERLSAERPSPAIVDIARGIARDVTLPTLIDRLVNRLESDRDFTAAFKQTKA
jgi:hypothetical protein